MAAHILVMNGVAPVMAVAALGLMRGRGWAASGPVLPTLVQMMLFWAWHAPPMLQSASHLWHGLMGGSLLAASSWYWLSVFGLRRVQRWRAILSLLITSKLFCLLGVLYVFAPRALYPDMALHHAAAMPARLADQQLAGLIMLVVCPATYLVAGVWIAAQWLWELDDQEGIPVAAQPGQGAASGAR